MVDIFLLVDGTYVSLLSIPFDDVQRLSIRPFKWLRFIVFSICGARGDLSAAPGGPLVDYNSTSLDDVEYYYNPQESCIFIDYQGLNDRITSTAHTPRSNTFRENVMNRDGPFCVVTRASEVVCDAAHLMPKSKGDEYINKVIQNRSSRYDRASWSSISGINAVENGLLLRKDVHWSFGRGEAAFLKTPNFALDPADLPGVGQSPTRSSRITIQQLKAPDDYDPNEAQNYINSTSTPNPRLCFDLGLSVDVAFRGSGDFPPPAIILDFLYGVAAYNLWCSATVPDVIKNYHTEHYKSIPLLPGCPDPSSDEFSSMESDDSRDGGYEPRTPTPTRRNVLAQAMDKMNMFLMYIHGITPEEAAERWERQREEEELAAQEASRKKVAEWVHTTDKLLPIT